MVFCIAALAVFAVLGIFSAKYRRYFRESLHCLSRQMTLRSCDTQFDQQMKAKITAETSKYSPALARFVFKRFALLSWILLVVMIFSVSGIVFGVYNFALYGNCNGPESTDFCVYGLLNQPTDVSKIKPVAAGDNPTIGNPDAFVKIVELGCYSCPYTKDAESIRTQLIQKYGDNVSFTFRDMPLPAHNLSFERSEAAHCARDQNKYWEYHDKLFEYQDIITVQKLRDIAQEIGLNMTQFSECLDSGKYKQKVQADYEEAIAAGIYATPTYFVNGRPFVGLKAFADFEQIVVGEIKGSCEA